MKINHIISFVIIIILLSDFCVTVNGFANKTHKAISEKSVINSQTDTYIKNELGLGHGLETMLLLDQGVIPAGERIPYSQFEARITPELPSNPCSILNYLRAGANLEDAPNPRARHHFHSPIANPGVNPPNPNSGLNNKTDHPTLADLLDFLTRRKFHLSFDLTGASAERRALGAEGAEWETEYLNYYAWPDTRTYFYRSLTKSTPEQRNHYLAMTFISMGQTIHLLEDMGVPAHTRNDFISGHTQIRELSWGNPFEHWTEKQVDATSDDSIPSSWLTGWTPQPMVFDKIAKYWDTDLYDGSYVGATPLSNWGLSEQTNYQFLSTSTVFGCEGTRYQFPQPDESHTALTSEQKIGENKYLRYYQGYGFQHLARQTYSNYVSYGYSPDAITVTKKTITPDDDDKVYQDYIKVTIPRTIDYTTGLINYFFRGQLEIKKIDYTDTDIIVTFVNKSNNSGVPQALKGGTFELYLDDIQGNRTKVNDFTVPGWGLDSTLNYNGELTVEFVKPGTTILPYTLIYTGSISENPDEPDLDDQSAVAVVSWYSFPTTLRYGTYYTVSLCYDHSECQETACPGPPPFYDPLWVGTHVKLVSDLHDSNRKFYSRPLTIEDIISPSTALKTDDPSIIYDNSAHVTSTFVRYHTYGALHTFPYNHYASESYEYWANCGIKISPFDLQPTNHKIYYCYGTIDHGEYVTSLTNYEIDIPEMAPGAARYGWPDEEVDVEFNPAPDLEWDPSRYGGPTESYDIYLGTTPYLGPEDFKGNQIAPEYYEMATYSPGVLLPGTTYYWRIDTINSVGTTTGDIWTFTTIE